MNNSSSKLSVLLVVSLSSFLGGFANAAELSDKDFWVLKIDDENAVDSNNYYFTWLGCASCQMVEEGADLTQFEKLPLIARPDWRPAAKIQIALQMLSIEEEIQIQFLTKAKDSTVDIKSMDAMSALLISLGVDEETLTNTLSSKALFQKVAEAERIANQFNIQYVPTAVVSGKYATDAKHAGSVANFGQIVKQLKAKN